MLGKNRLLLIALLIASVFIVNVCETPKVNVNKDKNGKTQETSLPDNNQKTEFKETVVQIKDIQDNTELEVEYGIMVIRFMLDDDSDNKLVKLPNFRIKGMKLLEIDNSPQDIQKDAIHILKLPSGKYSISSLYSINKKGEYEFDKPFPNNTFTVEKGKINYIGDIKVKLEEEPKSENIISRKLKLRLPQNTEDSQQIIKDKLKILLEKYPLEKKTITFR